MIHNMNLAQYMEIWNRIRKWQKKTGEKRIPNWVDISDFKIKDVAKVYKAQIEDMKNRVQAWKNSHNGAMPRIIGIEGASTTPEPIEGPIEKYAESKLGEFKTMTEFYNKLIGRGYKKYYNDVKTRKETIDAVAGNDPDDKPNCTDIMQVFHDLAIEKGYECRFIHVECKEGGHIRGQIRGKEFKDWTRVDPAAALSVYSKYPIGNVWCDYINAHEENSSWLNNDDGKT